MSRYRKPPILEAVLEFRWPSLKTVQELEGALGLSVFEEFEKPKERFKVTASLQIDSEEFEHNKGQIGFELKLRDGSQRVFLDQEMFVFIQSAPYDRWDEFSSKALSLLFPTMEQLGIESFSRVGVRFVNRIDAPFGSNNGIETDDYVNVHFSGPRKDKGVIESFQMRVVKPTERNDISYALSVGTTASLLPRHSGILVDIDVFTKKEVPGSHGELTRLLNEMREEKNAIFEECITDKSRALFGGLEE